MTGVAARWSALGTTASVRVSQQDALAPARDAVERELDAIDRACSRFREDSDLTRLNQQAGSWAAPHPLLWKAIGTALRAAELTGGLVDPTVGNALILAGYDRDFEAGLTEPAPTVKAHRVPGWKAIQVDAARHRVRVPRGVRLDLGATAKALAADRAARAAHAECECPVLVNLGGDIALGGEAPDDGWLVRVTDDHRAPSGPSDQVIALRSGGLATSSTTVRRWGTQSHHIIDPATGSPAHSCWRTVSVAAANCVDANIASTAAIVKGRDAADWLAELGLPARLTRVSGEVVTVGAWPAEVAA